MKFIPDFLSFAGLALLGYGLYLKAPWVAFAVCGALLIVYGVGAELITIFKAKSR